MNTTFHIKKGTKQVLEALAKLGTASAADIASYTNKPKPSVYDALNELIKMGMVSEQSGNTGRTFSLADPEQIQKIKAIQISKISSVFDEITELRRNQKEIIVARPRIRFYSGVEGIQQAFRDNDWQAKYKDAYLMWPMKTMIEAVGEKFLKNHSAGHLYHKVMLHAISHISDKEVRGEGEWLKSDPKTHYREVRYAPKDMDWSMSFWAYGDKTLFAGGGKEKFAFVVHSKEFTDLITILWKRIWDISTE